VHTCHPDGIPDRRGRVVATDMASRWDF
jgi:hypothetical protein